MDDVMVADIRERLAGERTRQKSRSTPPDQFPKLPDIPLGRYTDERFFRAEIDQVFRKGWLFAGHESEFPTVGSYRLLDIPFAPVILARGEDGMLRGLLNACRHRGAPVIRDSEGTTRKFVCQFHSWSYDLCGRLLHVPEERDFVGLVREERPLGTVRVETWAGLIFINLDHDAPSLAESLAPIQRRFSDLAEAPLRLVQRKNYDLPCNWKVAVEAFLETYHIKTVHAQTAAKISEPSRTLLSLHPNGHMSLFMPYQDRIVEEGPSSFIFQAMFPSDLPSASNLPDLYLTTVVLFSIFPNFVSPVDPKGFPIVLFWPLTVDTTRMEMHWYGVDWGDGPVPQGWEMKLAAWDYVIEEDLKNLAPIQESIEVAAHRGVPLGYQERGIWNLHAEIDRRIGSENIAIDLRVPDVLGYALEP